MKENFYNKINLYFQKVYKSDSKLASLRFENESFSKFIEIGRFFQSYDELGVDGLFITSFDIFRSDVLDGGETVFGEDLSKLADERDGFSHTLDLSRPMLFENKLGKEQSLVQSCVSSDSEDVGFVELRALGTHLDCVEYSFICFYDYKSFNAINMWKIIFN